MTIEERVAALQSAVVVLWQALEEAQARPKTGSATHGFSPQLHVVDGEGLGGGPAADLHVAQ